MREPKTKVPGLVLNLKGKSRIAYLAAEVDSRHGRDNFPDHANLLANIVRWAAEGHEILNVSGPGLLDCHLYAQPHCCSSLDQSQRTRPLGAPVEKLIPVGPVHVRVKLSGGIGSRSAHSLVSSKEISASVNRD